MFITDSYSAVGHRGYGGIAVELVRLFAVELEHYEKIEGVPLSLDGKANRLATMVRGNLGAALQGFVVVPLFAGYDLDATDPAAAGRIVSFDAAGGRYEEKRATTRSARARCSRTVVDQEAVLPALRRLDGAIRTAVEALYDAADDDSATGGPDLIRHIYPVVVIDHRATVPSATPTPTSARSPRPW